MKRHKRPSMKKKKPEPASNKCQETKEQDLAYYVHDRVELMRQVFSVLTPREIKAMAPERMRKFSNDDIEEICLDELLGISSKRVCAVIDGAKPPSDTSSSESEASESGARSQVDPETISLDSISDVSQRSAGKKKHRKRRCRRRKSASSGEGGGGGGDGRVAGVAGGAGGTVLELLELQARARALRSKLAGGASPAPAPAPAPVGPAGPALKREVPEVLEISSEEEERKHVPQPEPPPPASPATLPPPDRARKKKKKTKARSPPPQTSKQVATPSPAPQSDVSSVAADGEKQTDLLSENAGLVIVLDDDDTPTETPAAGEAKNSPINDKRSKSSDVPRNATPQTTRTIQMSNNNVVISVKTAPEPEARVASVVKAAKKINSTVTKIKKPEKLNSQVVDDKKSAKRRNRRKSIDKDGSDQYEITLQLSDSEKMDLLEDLDHRDLDAVSSGSDSRDSDSSSTTDTSDGPAEQSDDASKTVISDITHINKDDDLDNKAEKSENEAVSDGNLNNDGIDEQKNNKDDDIGETVPETVKETEITVESLKSSLDNVNESYIGVSSEPTIEVTCIDDIPIVHEEFGPKNQRESGEQRDGVEEKSPENTRVSIETDINISENNAESISEDRILPLEARTTEEINANTTENTEEPVQKTSENDDKIVEEGELTDKSDSEVEAFEVQPEVVLISDEDEPDSGNVKKKKIKKHKKEKKCKKHRQARPEVADENFLRHRKESLNNQPASIREDEVTPVKALSENVPPKSPVNIESDVCEILDLSDDSSCYEVEGVTVSKEPTSEEIENLSAKIDEIQRVDVLTGEQIPEIDQTEENAEKISWKDRYLDSTKVKKVMTTANIVNAMRKKNKELKKKMLESKRIELEFESNKPEVQKEVAKEVSVEEGSLEHYNLLEGSTKYVHPVPESEGKSDLSNETDKDAQLNLTDAMKKDAKQLLKMYKRLLKYNADKKEPKQKDPNKKKKSKKHKRKKDGVAAGTRAAIAENT